MEKKEGDTYYSLERNRKNEINYRINQSFLKIMKYLLIITYYIASIIALFIDNYAKERNICKYSDLWIYLLFSLIFNLILLKKVLKYNDNLNITTMKKLCKMIIFKLGFIIWACLLFYSVPCIEDIKGTFLFTMSLIQYLIDIIIFFGYFVGFLYIYFNSENQGVDFQQVREGNLNHIISEDNYEDNSDNIETVKI